MKKRSKRLTAGILLLCMMLGAPFALADVEAAKTGTASGSVMPLPGVPDWMQEESSGEPPEEESGAAESEEESEPDESGKESTNTPEEEREPDESEKESTEKPEEESVVADPEEESGTSEPEEEGGTSEPEEESETADSEDQSKTEEELTASEERNPLQDDITIIAEESGISESGTGSLSAEELPSAGNVKKGTIASIVAETAGNGVYDYRQWIDGSVKTEIKILDVIDSVQAVAHGGAAQPQSGASIGEEETGKLAYKIGIDNTDVICINEKTAEKIFSEGTKSVYKTKEELIPFEINTVGAAKLTINASGSRNYKILPFEKEIVVKDSSLYDEDFYIEVRQESDPDSENRRYRYEEWLQYLEAHHHWADGTVRAVMSDSGRRYYQYMRMASDEPDASGKQEYTLWAVNPQTKADTKAADNGTRTFTAGVDRKAPELASFTVDSVCYEPTKTNTEQYFAEDFVLRGSYRDGESGLSRIEYTTDYTDGETAQWTLLADEEGEQKDTIDFEIVLSDGCYNAIALRAYDHAGNVSAVKGFVNDSGGYIKVTVDKSEPALAVEAVSGGAAYDGEGERWTNKDVAYTLSFDKDSCPYAGIYKYAYAYEKIGDAVNREDTSQLPDNNWTWAPADGADAGLDVTEDKNGYYHFQAVSKTGVKTKEIVSRRLLVQHQLAEIKPIQVKGADNTKRRNNWYNKASGTPTVSFAYPDYDSGVTSGEYDAPVTIHYSLTAETEGDSAQMAKAGDDGGQAAKADAEVSVGVMDSGAVRTDGQGRKVFVLTKEDLKKHTIDFGFDKDTGYARDGIYTLSYWVTDKAGNASDKQTATYRIDCHEPTELVMEVAQQEMPLENEDTVVYERFYQGSVECRASVQYGISGKGAFQALKARKTGEWENAEDSSFCDAEQFSIEDGERCFLYVCAQDLAGNRAEGWTRGIVADSMAPNAANHRELIIEPEGANEHGFFKDDVSVKISIKDAPEDDNCAALMTVTGSVGRDGVDTVTDKELFSFTKELPTDKELADASAFEAVQTVDASENDSNDAYIEVSAVDRAGNTKTSRQQLKIDATKPEIEIRFEQEDALNGSFYSQGRTAVIRVKERNFDLEAVELAVTKDGKPVDMPLSGWTAQDGEHYATVFFGEDGDYTMEAHCTDLAGNVSDTAQAAPFTVDCTAPQIDIALVPEGENAGAAVEGHQYFNTDVVAVIKVTEHNFNENAFVFDSAPASEKAVWSHEGDVHTARVAFHAENTYQMRCACTDLAGNAAVDGTLSKEFIRDFTIDKTAPLLSIDGVADGSANSGEVIPVVTALDLHMEADAVSIMVVTGRGEAVENAAETAAVEDGSGTGYRFTLNDMTDKEDDIYYLSVSARDRAGNESALAYRFSLNRNGSTYDLTQLVDLMERQYNNYASFEDIVITEMNIDKVDQFEVYISRNGEIGHKADFSRKVSGSADTGYVYTYGIGRKNFAQEGVYRLSLYSKDKAGNEVNNALELNGREIMFVVDNTVPKVTIDGVEAGKVYDVESQEVSICVADNFLLEEAEFMLVNSRNEVLERWDYMELSHDSDTVRITIPTYNEEVSLIYKIKDAAGNEMQTLREEQDAFTDFLVTKDKVVQFINKPTKTLFGRSVLIMAAAAMAAGIALSAAAVLRVRRRK